MKVLVVESCRSEDFYFQELDGPATYRLLRLLGHSAELKYALDRKYFRSAIAFATSRPFKVLHLSCHGDADGIQLSNLTEIGWDTFTGYFQDGIYCPDALVMSACQGASIGLAKSFAKREQRPKIIFGTTANRHYHDYAVAWAILYRRFRYGVHRDAAQKALREICAVVHHSFVYRRWDDDQEKYLNYPSASKGYAVEEIDRTE